MKSTADLLFKLRHAIETGTFAVFDPTEAAALLERFNARTNLLAEAPIFPDADVHDCQARIDEELNR